MAHLHNSRSAPQRMRDVQDFGEEGGVVPVIDVAATSTFLNPEDMERTFHGETKGCYLYSRHSNPSVNAFGKKIAALEDLPAALGLASGMAAISSTIFQLMPNGGHLISSLTVYGGTYAFFANILPKWNVRVTFVDTSDLAAVAQAMTPETKAIYTETMSNPLLRVADLRGLAEICHAREVKLIVDNTFTPVIVTPAHHGADIVLHSCTKYISGASDLIAGAVAGPKEFIDSLIDINHGMVMLTGPVMDPRVAHELYLRLDHLPARMVAHSQAALSLASHLARENVPVIYPGLAGHDHHGLLSRQANSGFGFGGMMAVDCGTGRAAMNLASLLQKEKFGLYAVSLGFSRTLMSCPSVSTSSEIPEADQKKMKLSPGLLRLSIGLVGDSQVMIDRFMSCWREAGLHSQRGNQNLSL